MPSALVGVQTEAMASRTAASMAALFCSRPRHRCVYDDQTRFSATGTGPTSARDVGDDPMWKATVSTQPLMTLWLTSPCIRTSVGPRSSGTPSVQNHQLPSGSVDLP